MKFGPLPVAAAEGAILAHAIKHGGLVLKKGTRLGADELAALQGAGVESVIVAQLEAGDIGEDAAAHQLARAIAGSGLRVEEPFTGRSNLFAETDGVLVVDAVIIDAINAVDEAITAATLAAFKPVVAGEMVATVKIIPFSVPERMLERALAQVVNPALRVAPYVRRSVAVISTLLPGLKPSVVDKTLKVMAERLAPAGAAIVKEIRVPHDAAALAEALRQTAPEADITVVFGASAITDRSDVIPAALIAAGGAIEHFGMPVDPGNLLLIGDLGGRPVLGAPGCARSPRLNGFDWVLQRLLAGIAVTRGDIQRLGVGGLLMEIVSRPQPRAAEAIDAAAGDRRHVEIIILAAGRSTRMGGENKLLADIDGKPLIRHTLEAALAADVGPVRVVLGHERERVAAALGDLPVSFIHNPRFADGISTSVAAGLANLSSTADGAIVVLGDMPLVPAHVLRRLAAAFAEQPDALAVVPTTLGERGNPVLLSRRLFPALATMTGDAGARRVLEAAGESIVEIAVDNADIHRDIDTPEALAALRAQYGR